jgi:hypothetical protein
VIRRAVYAVYCDQPRCNAEYIAAQAMTGAQAAADAAGNHWQRIRDGVLWRDLCPDHKTEEAGR